MNMHAMPQDETPFRLRSYGKSELAQMYLPNIQSCSARREFNEWIDFYPDLRRQLADNGLTPKSKRYTPTQVKLIVAVLGEP